MTYGSRSFQGIAADAGSTALPCWGLFDKWISCIGLSAGTGTVQWSNDDGTTWTTLRDATGSPVAFTAAGVVEVPQAVRLLRILGASLAGASFALNYAEPTAR